MNPANPVPARTFSTHLEIPEKRYEKQVRHDWSRARYNKVTCKICGMKIHKDDKIFNLYCPDERLEVIEHLKGIEYLLNNQPAQKEPWSRFNKKYVLFDRKDWNKWINSIRAQLRRQE